MATNRSESVSSSARSAVDVSGLPGSRPKTLGTHWSGRKDMNPDKIRAVMIEMNLEFSKDLVFVIIVPSFTRRVRLRLIIGVFSYFVNKKINAA